MCQKSITLCNPLGVGDLNIEKVDASTWRTRAGRACSDSMDPVRFILICLAGWLNKNQQDVIDYLREEVRVLREQHGPKRMRFTDEQRSRLARKAKRIKLGWKNNAYWYILSNVVRIIQKIASTQAFGLCLSKLKLRFYPPTSTPSSPLPRADCYKCIL